MVFDKILNDNKWRDAYADIMSKERSIDIDVEFDFLMAEEIMKYYKGNRSLRGKKKQ